MKLQKTICCKISKWCHWQSDLGNPNSATNDRITFHLWLCSKLVSPIIFTFHQNRALKKLCKMLFVLPKLLFWLLQYSNFRRKLGIEKQITLTSWYGFCQLPTLNFRKIQKPLQIKGSKMVRGWTTKEKLPHIYGNIAKVVPGTFGDFAHEQLTYLLTVN